MRHNVTNERSSLRCVPATAGWPSGGLGNSASRIPGDAAEMRPMCIANTLLAQSLLLPSTFSCLRRCSPCLTRCSRRIKRPGCSFLCGFRRRLGFFFIACFPLESGSGLLASLCHCLTGLDGSARSACTGFLCRRCWRSLSVVSRARDR